MQIVSPAMADRLLKMIETGSENVSTELADILNQLTSYIIFLEVISLLKWSLLFVGAVIIARAFKFWILSAEKDSDKEFIKGWRNILVGIMTITAIWTSLASAVGLGKILLAPKLYMIEMAIDKVKEIQKK